MRYETRGNTGNFLAALQMIAYHDGICMGQEKLSSLALMHIHYQAKIDLDEANLKFDLQSKSYSSILAIIHFYDA